MTTADLSPHADTGDLASFGYTQELHRSVGGFVSFAAGFSFVSILTTTFQLFGFGFSFGGPAFFWTWPIVFVGQFSVALCFAELAARYPISGAVYQWSRRLSSEVVGWFAGWLMLIGYIVSVAAIAIALQSVLPEVWSGFQLVGGDPSLTSTSGATNAILIGSICIAICTVISSVGIRFTGRITTVGVSCEIIGVLLVIVLLFAHAQRGPGAVTHTNGLGGGGAGYFWPFIASMLMAAYVMYGFDSAAELSEETNNPRGTAPRAIIQAMVVSGIGGGLLLVAGLLAAPSLTDANLATGGLSYVVTSALGTGLGKVVLVDVAISIFSAALAIQASASRVAFSMARDGRLPFSTQLARVSPKTRTAIWPGVMVSALAIGVLVVNLGQASLFTAVTGVSVVIVYLAYLLVTVPLLIQRFRGQATPNPAFSLGRWGIPVNIIAVVFGAVMLVNIGWPRAAVYDPEGGHWYLQWFSLLFLGGCLALGFLAHRALHRPGRAPATVPAGNGLAAAD